MHMSPKLLLDKIFEWNSILQLTYLILFLYVYTQCHGDYKIFPLTPFLRCPLYGVPGISCLLIFFSTSLLLHQFFSFRVVPTSRIFLRCCRPPPSKCVPQIFQSPILYPHDHVTCTCHFCFFLSNWSDLAPSLQQSFFHIYLRSHCTQVAEFVFSIEADIVKLFLLFFLVWLGFPPGDSQTFIFCMALDVYQHARLYRCRLCMSYCVIESNGKADAELYLRQVGVSWRPSLICMLRMQQDCNIKYMCTSGAQIR